MYPIYKNKDTFFERMETLNRLTNPGVNLAIA